MTTIPLIRLAPPSDPNPLRRVASRLPSYDWVAVTSVNAVERLADAARAAGSSAPLAGCRLAAIGPATARAARGQGSGECLVPSAYRGEALAESLIAATAPESRAAVRALVVQAERGRPALRERLVAAGIQVDAVPAYAVEANLSARARLREFVQDGRGDWLTFTSSSAVRAFVKLVGGPRTGGARVAAISPVTAATLAGEGLPVDAVADVYSVQGLVEGLVTAAAAAPARAGPAPVAERAVQSG